MPAPNSRQDLANADMVMQDRIRASTATRASARLADQHLSKMGASIGVDTSIFPFSFIGRDASIGR
jgi:UDP-3-O-[3-hydroxymyristoyl] glucosamine N-acyltransferase